MDDINKLSTFSKEELILQVQDLNKKNQELENLLKESQEKEILSGISVLASGTAQKLLKPINLTLLNLNFIANNIEEDNPVFDYINSIKTEMAQLKTISDQLMNLSNTQDKTSEIIDLKEIIEQPPINNLLLRTIKKGYTVNKKFPSKSVCIMASKNNIIEILILLINNAIDAMPDQNEELSIVIEEAKKDGHTFASISIIDTGLGIPEEKLAKVFEPF